MRRDYKVRNVPQIMKKHLWPFVILICCLNTKGFTQILPARQWIVNVIDQEKGTPISFATISINRKEYFPANEKGELILKEGTIKAGDTIIISAIGFKSQVIVADVQIPLPSVIRLAADVINLKEVSVKYKKPEEITIGKKGLFLTFGYLTHLSMNFAQYIPNNKKISGLVEAIEFNLSNAGKDIKGPFSVSIYSKSPGNQNPDKELINDDLIVQNPEGKRKLDLDITKYNIQFPENGLFVVIRMLSSEYYSNATFFAFGNYREELPSFVSYEKRNDDEDGYFLSSGDKSHWALAPFNFLIRLKVLKE